jgi:hypothetical protein
VDRDIIFPLTCGELKLVTEYLKSKGTDEPAVPQNFPRWKKKEYVPKMWTSI